MILERLTRWAQRLLRDGTPGQFVRYALCGVAATVVDMAVFYAFAWRLIPALGAGDPLVRLLGVELPALDVAVRARNFAINRGLAFVASNFAAYLLNIRWVFRAGRHRRAVELTLFYVVSVFSWMVGTAAGWVLISAFGLSTTLSYGANIVSAALVNFVCRKVWIFKR